MKKIDKIRKFYFAEQSKRSGIPLKFYQPTQEEIDWYNTLTGVNKKLLPTRGEVSIKRHTRRSVGDFGQ